MQYLHTSKTNAQNQKKKIFESHEYVAAEDVLFCFFLRTRMQTSILLKKVLNTLSLSLSRVHVLSHDGWWIRRRSSSYQSRIPKRPDFGDNTTSKKSVRNWSIVPRIG